MTKRQVTNPKRSDSDGSGPAAARLVLRIERDGQLLGSWSLADAPLEMKMVDVASGQVVARFTASAELLEGAAPRRADQGVDEVPLPISRLTGDDFTLPLPEPSISRGRLPTDETAVRVSRPVPNLAKVRGLTTREWKGDGLTSELVDVEEAGDGLTSELVDATGAIDGLTGELLEIDEEAPYDEVPGLTAELVPDEDDEARTGELYRVLDQVPTAKVPPARSDVTGANADEGDADVRHDELPIMDRPTLAGAGADMRTATGAAAGATTDKRLATDDEPSLTAKRPAGLTDPEHTPQSLVAPGPQRREPAAAEVWAQKRGEWRSVGRLVPGQRVSTLGGWVRLSPDGRLVVHSGETLAGTATLVDGRMLEVAPGQDFLALPPGSSVMLAVGDRGLYVRSEPLPDIATEAASHARAH